MGGSGSASPRDPLERLQAVDLRQLQVPRVRPRERPTWVIEGEVQTSSQMILGSAGFIEHKIFINNN